MTIQDFIDNSTEYKIGDKNLWITSDNVIKELSTGNLYYTNRRYSDVLYKSLGLGSHKFIDTLRSIDNDVANDLILKKWNSSESDRLVYLNNLDKSYTLINPNSLHCMRNIVDTIYSMGLKENKESSIHDSFHDDTYLEYTTTDKDRGISIQYSFIKDTVSVHTFSRVGDIFYYAHQGIIYLNDYTPNEMNDLISILYSSGDEDLIYKDSLSKFLLISDLVSYSKLYGRRVVPGYNTVLSERDMEMLADYSESDKNSTKSTTTVKDLLLKLSDKIIDDPSYKNKTYINVLDSIKNKYI